MMSKKDKDNTEEIIKLNDYRHVRIRTNMYLGSKDPHTQAIITYRDGTPELVEMTWIPALYTAWREIVDNALDEVCGHGYGNKIDIIYDETTLTVSVQDNGRGIPIEYDSDYKMHKATLALTEAKAGRNFRDRGFVAGTNGIGASAVVYSSEWFKMEIVRDSKKFVQEFKEGTPALDDLFIKKPKITDSTSNKTGTKITFKLSRQVFTHTQLPEQFIKDRVYEIAMCNPLIKIYYNGEYVKVKPAVDKNIFPDQKPISIEIKEKDSKLKFFLIPNFTEDGETVHTIVNNIPAFNGGIHTENFKKFFYTGLIAALEREGKRRKLIPNRSDINEGLLIYNVTTMKAPNFDSQAKTRLINEEIGNIVKINLESEKIFKDIIRKNSEWIEQIFNRCLERTNRKDAAELNKLSKRVMRNKVASLMDANGRNRTECILFLMEGQSACGGVSEVRDSTIHGALPLRGKVMNVNGENTKKILDNQVLVDIMNAVGLAMGKKAERKQLRYGKVYIAHDMDEDGKHIGALLLNFFYTYWPELFDKTLSPFFYIFSTPFIIATKGKDRKYWYSHNYEQFKSDDWKGWGITRAKGLGTLEKSDWEHSLKKPELFPLIEDGKLKESLDLIFNNKRSDDRKEWISLDK
jgi:DNA gyrase/topoisomerase IV subunit B